MTVSTLRAVFRTTTEACHFANSFVIINRINQLQGYKCYHSINRISKETAQKGIFAPMDWNKKRNTGTPVWRQINTQSSPSKECLVEASVAESANIASIEKGKIKTDEAEATVVNPSSSYTSDALKDSEDAFRDSSTASVSQNIVGGQDSGKMTLSKNKHAVSVEVGASVMRFIKGKDGSTLKGIEGMGVKIEFPPLKTGDSIVIEGDSVDDIAKASQKIQSIIDEAAKSPNLAYTHIISLPLAIHPQLVDKVTRFQSSILGYDPKVVKGAMAWNSRTGASVDADKVDQPVKEDLAVGVKLKREDDINPVKLDIRNIPIVNYAPKATKSATLIDLRIDDSIFHYPQTLHLPVLLLKLWNKERIHAAVEVLQGIHSKVNEVLDNRPLFVRLKGLEFIGGSKEKAQVLYVPIEEIGGEGRLTSACQIITDAYVRAGLVFNEKDAEPKLKLRATLMNTAFRRGRSKKNPLYDSFNARGIFKQFEREEWGEYHIREAHLSQRLAYDDNGYYHCCGAIPFPENSLVHEAGVEPAHAELEKTPMAHSA